MLPRGGPEHLTGGATVRQLRTGAGGWRYSADMNEPVLPATEPVLDYSSATAELPKAELLQELRRRVLLLVEGERDWLANLGNAAAEIFALLPDVNWVGWYVRRGDELVLGPFQGRPACVRIPFGRGVCGTAAATRETQVVPDVSEFPGHIACDVRSRSEIVVPVVVNGETVAVLDLDSPETGTFTHEDRIGLEALVRELSPHVDWERVLNS